MLWAFRRGSPVRRQIRGPKCSGRVITLVRDTAGVRDLMGRDSMTRVQKHVVLEAALCKCPILQHDHAERDGQQHQLLNSARALIEWARPAGPRCAILTAALIASVIHRGGRAVRP